MGKKEIRDYLKSCEDGSAIEIIDYTDEAIAAALKEDEEKPIPPK